MSNILEYTCGCKYYVGASKIEPMELCKEHKIQAEKATLEALIGMVKSN